jgi:hypothetical protein
VLSCVSQSPVKEFPGGNEAFFVKPQGKITRSGISPAVVPQKEGDAAQKANGSLEIIFRD